MTMIPNMARKPIYPTHGADDQRSCAFPSRVTQTEVRPDRPTKGSMRESESVTPLCHVVEGDLASIIVQENPHPLKRGPQGRAVIGEVRAQYSFPYHKDTAQNPFWGAEVTPPFLHTESSQTPMVHLALSPTSTSQ